MIGGAKVAIIDDDAAVRESMCFLLELIGYPVVAYGSAFDFLAQVDTSGVAGLILDHHMPIMTGLELAAELRSQGRKFPILLITGSPSPAIVEQAARLGIHKVLEKPPREEELVSFINSLSPALPPNAESNPGTGGPSGGDESPP